MNYFFFGADKVNLDEYEKINKERGYILYQLNNLNKKLLELESRFKLLDSIFNPKMNIIEANNKSMGHRYIGKFRVESQIGKKKEFVISIGRVENYQGKKDPLLLEHAKIKALEQLKKKHPEIF